MDQLEMKIGEVRALLDGLGVLQDVGCTADCWLHFADDVGAESEEQAWAMAAGVHFNEAIGAAFYDEPMGEGYKFDPDTMEWVGSYESS